MSKDRSLVQAMRKDTLEGLELSNEAKKAQQAKQQRHADELECNEDGFTFATS